MRATSQAGIDLIKKWEGLRLTAYQCSAGVWTVGYGYTWNVYKGMKITQSQADAFLRDTLKVFERDVNRLVTVQLNQNQFDALVSFTYNLGAGALANSTLLKKLNAGDYYGASQEFKKWVYADKKKLRGLVNRRKDEAELFLNPIEPIVQKPLTKSRTMKTSAALGAGGAVTAVAGLAPALPVVQGIAETAQDHTRGFMIVIGLVIVVAAAYIMWVRRDDSKKGVR